jgi:hypothetical protein
MMNRKTNTVIELAQKAEAMSLRQVGRKSIFNLSVIVITAVILAIDLWIILQGMVATGPEKKLAVFIAFGALALFLVGLLSQSALFIGVFSYQRLLLALEKEEKEEAVEEETALIEAIKYAFQGQQRRQIVEAIKKSMSVKEHPGLEKILIEELAV